MKIRCTKKLAKKINIILPKQTYGQPFSSEWYANLIRHEGIQYIVVTDSGTLATVLFEGRGIVSANDLAASLRSTITRMFKRNGWTFALGRFVDIDEKQTEILPTTDKRVTGSLTEMIRLKKGHLEYGDRDIETIADQVNKAPMAYIDYKAPK